MLKEGGGFGWPYTYYDFRKKARMVAPEYGGDNEKRAEAGKYPEPLVVFPAHWAPLQMAFYSGDQFPERYRGGAFVAFHGSWNRAPQPQKGYKVAFVPFDAQGMPSGGYEVFADGFAGQDEVATPRDARFRPGGLAVGPDGSLYVADTERGRVWRIFHTGESAAAAPLAASDASIPVAASARTPAPAASPHPPAAAAATKSLPATSASADRGEAVYLEICALCHMPDGSGVPNMQPALTKRGLLSGDAVTLIRLVLFGPDAVLPPNRPTYQNPMPELSALTDEEIADSLNYARRRFALSTPSVTPSQVQAERGKAPKPRE
jgi:mono/diheme cytochrome c family protein